MSQIQKKFLADNAVDGDKIRLGNNEPLQGRDFADASNIDLIKTDASDNVVLGDVSNNTRVASPNFIPDSATSNLGGPSNTWNLYTNEVRTSLVWPSNNASLQSQDAASTNGITLASGDASAGDSGDVNLIVGTATGTQGEFRFMKSGVSNSVGDVWTASNTNGEGYWAAPTASIGTDSVNSTHILLDNATWLRWENASAASWDVLRLNSNNRLELGSNVLQFHPQVNIGADLGTSTLRWNQVNANQFVTYNGILPDTSDSRDVGSSGSIFRTGYFNSFRFRTSGIEHGQITNSGTTPSGNSGTMAFFSSGTSKSLGLFTSSGTASPNLYVETGNASAGNSGDINIRTGTSSGGQRGDINLTARELNVSVSQSVGMPVWEKYTVSHTAFQTAALTNDIELFSLPAKGAIHSIIIKHETAFSGTGITNYEVSVGISGDLSKYASAFDVFQSTGSSVAQSTSVFDVEDFSSSTSIRIAATSAGANLDQSAAGSVDVYVLWGILP